MSYAISADGVTSHELTGIFDKIRNVRNGMGWLLLPDMQALYGELKEFDSVAQTAVFLMSEVPKADLVDKSLPLISAYWQPY